MKEILTNPAVITLGAELSVAILALILARVDPKDRIVNIADFILDKLRSK